jgi:hypothetical protein
MLLKTYSASIDDLHVRLIFDLGKKVNFHKYLLKLVA